MDLGDNNEETQQEKVCAPLVMSTPRHGFGKPPWVSFSWVYVVQGLTSCPLLQAGGISQQ